MRIFLRLPGATMEGFDLSCELSSSEIQLVMQALGSHGVLANRVARAA